MLARLLARYAPPRYESLPIYQQADDARLELYPLPGALPTPELILETAERRAEEVGRGEAHLDKKAADLLTLCVTLASLAFGAARWLPLDCPPLVVGFLAPLCWAIFNLMAARRSLRVPSTFAVAAMVAEQAAKQVNADQARVDLALSIDLATVGRTAILGWRAERFDEAITAVFVAALALPVLVVVDHFCC